jgi:hypothetical protein
MESAGELHDRLTRAYAALHAVAALPCLTRPDDAEAEEESRGYRQPCKFLTCGPCLAWHALAVEGRLPL